MDAHRNYRGRFAPTPSGPLHFGSLTTALASWLDARAHNGYWGVRIEDTDTPRCSDKAATTILTQLERYGLYWDDDVVYQHTRTDAYQAALDYLIAAGKAYPCSCSRREWQTYTLYPGWCREGALHPQRTCAIRLRTDETCQPRTLPWHDRRSGHQAAILAAHGDVVLKRRDGLWAYQMAVVVDDALQDITDIVRGEDLFDNTPWQRLLQYNLGYPAPRYLHLPLMRADNGQKLSKQNKAPALPEQDDQIRTCLFAALKALMQQPPAALKTLPVEEQLQWSVKHWQPDALR